MRRRQRVRAVVVSSKHSCRRDLFIARGVAQRYHMASVEPFSSRSELPPLAFTARSFNSCRRTSFSACNRVTALLKRSNSISELLSVDTDCLLIQASNSSGQAKTRPLFRALGRLTGSPASRSYRCTVRTPFAEIVGNVFPTGKSGHGDPTSRMKLWLHYRYRWRELKSRQCFPKIRQYVLRWDITRKGTPRARHAGSVWGSTAGDPPHLGVLVR